MFLIFCLSLFTHYMHSTWSEQLVKFTASALNSGMFSWLVATETFKGAYNNYWIDKQEIQAWPEVSSEVKNFCKYLITPLALKNKEEIEYRIFDGFPLMAALKTSNIQTIFFHPIHEKAIKELLTEKALYAGRLKKLTSHERHLLLQPYIWAFYHEVTHLENNDGLKRIIALPFFAAITQGLGMALRAGNKKISLIKYAPKNPFSIIAINAGTGIVKLSTTLLMHTAYKKNQEIKADWGAIQHFKNIEDIDSIIEYIDKAFGSFENKALAMHMQLPEDVIIQRKKSWLCKFYLFLLFANHPSAEIRKNQILKYRETLIATSEKKDLHSI